MRRSALFTFFGNALAADLAAVSLTIAAIALDGVDGYLARTRGLATPLGAQLDIVGDRIVENLFFMFFAGERADFVLGACALFCARHADGFSAKPGCAIGPRRVRKQLDAGNMVGTKRWWRRAPAARRYAILKCVCFCCLGLLLPMRRMPAGWFAASLRALVFGGAQALVFATVTFCVIRALPVIWDGRRYLNDVEKPVTRAVVRVTR